MSTDLNTGLEKLACAVWNGSSNPPLIKRANRLADNFPPECKNLAEQLRTALTKRGESLVDRHSRLEVIRKELAAMTTPGAQMPKRCFGAGPVHHVGTRFHDCAYCAAIFPEDNR